MKILVPLKRVADPDNANKVKIASDGSKVTSEGLEWKLNPFDEYAVEAALRITENAATNARLGEVVVVSLGPAEAKQQVTQALAMGADRGMLVEAADEALDASVVVDVLEKVVAEEKPDLILAGKQVVDGDSNQVAQMLAQRLGWPQATFAAKIETDAGLKTALVVREVDGGVSKLKLTFPAVISVDLRIVAPEGVKNGNTPAEKKYNDGPRYPSLKGIMQAKKKPLALKKPGDFGVTPNPRLEVLKFEPPPARKAGVKVPDVETLVAKLKNEARVI
ncbi:MAG: electron transfer flavoprotein subunit beta/FixA family protein [Deltaproteobacteria bacterium]|nr:electron transfer flavoprotein subunit beta/FixA family protein [Deltaproteobacteria bacterium]